MNKITYCSLYCFYALLSTASAQKRALPIGDKNKITFYTNVNSTTTVMGTQVVSDVEDSLFSETVLKSNSDTAWVFGITLKRVKGNFSAMGQNQSFDSDDKKSTDNPLMGQAISSIGKEQPLVIYKDKKRSDRQGNELLGMATIMSGKEEGVANMGQSLMAPKASFQNEVGYRWSESDTTPDGKNIVSTIYKLTRSDENIIEVSATNTTSIDTDIEAMGMKMHQKMILMGTTVSLYNKDNGKLISSKSEAIGKGAGDLMGTSVPMEMKITSKAIVE